MTKSDIEKIIIGMTLGECERLLKQYDYKLFISEMNGKKNIATNFSYKKTCFVNVEDNKITKSQFKKEK